MADYKMNQNAIDKLLEIAKTLERSYLKREISFQMVNELSHFACEVSDQCCIGYSGQNVEVVE